MLPFNIEYQTIVFSSPLRNVTLSTGRIRVNTWMYNIDLFIFIYQNGYMKTTSKYKNITVKLQQLPFSSPNHKFPRDLYHI